MQPPERENSKNLNVLLSIFSFIRPYKLQAALAGVALILTALISLSLGQGFRVLVDEGFVLGSAEKLTEVIQVLFLLVFLMAMGTFFRFYLVSWIGERVTADLRKAVFDHVIELHPSFFESNLSSEIQSRITTDTTLLQSLIGSSLSLALRNILMFIGGIIWLFITNTKLTMVVMVSVPLVVAPILFLGRRVRKLSNSAQQEIAHIGTYVGEALQNIKIVQGYNHQDLDKQRFSRQVETAFQVAIQRIRQRAILIALVLSLVFSSIVLMMWVGGMDVINGSISAGELVAFVFYSMIVGSSVAAISEVIGELQRAAGAMERLMDLLYADNQILPPKNSLSLPQQISGTLEIRNLTFAYPTRPADPAIQALSLKIEPGSSLALVGPSGAGKTTLFELLLRFYDAQQGQILFEGLDIRDLNPRDLRHWIGLVPQNPALFSDNVYENIRYGNPDATEEQIRQAAKAAFADEFIEKLPQKYNTYLGEAGVRLSGGQKQRIAIARAILKNPRILLLDEATSALDANSEYMVQQALQYLMKDRTTLIIAHRLATVKHVDQIAVFDDGKIVAKGTHQELKQQSPLYAQLAALQFREVS